MTAVLFLVLGVGLTLAVLLVWGSYADHVNAQPPAQTQAWLEQLRAQQRINELTQDTVRQMLKLARKEQP